MTAALRQFVTTSEHERFAEFCTACRREHYIGLCFGPPGIGKTMSARRVTRADELEALRAPFSDHSEELGTLRGLSTLLYTPDVINGPRAVTDHILGLWNRLLFIGAAGLTGPARRREDRKTDELASIVGTQSRTVRDANKKLAGIADAQGPKPFLHPLELLIVDEADRLKTQSLEQLRHLFDRGRFGLVLIGMPGIEKRLSRYPQLYSRIGFAHRYRALSTEELRGILLRQLPALTGAPAVPGLTDHDVLAAVLRITGGNLRLVIRLLAQVERILEVNETTLVTVEIVEAAREDLVIGTL